VVPHQHTADGTASLEKALDVLEAGGASGEA
jgi:hypothetical protein